MRTATSACGRTIGATVCKLLAELAASKETAPVGLRADIVADIDASQLLTLIRESIEKGAIHPIVPLPVMAKQTQIESKPTADGRYRQVTLRRDAHLTLSQQEVLHHALMKRIEQRVLHYSSDRRLESVKTGRAISEIARELAEHNAEDPTKEVTALQQSILANIQALIDARAIWPRTARTGDSAPRTEHLDVSWELNHRDVERIIHYSRLRNAQQRIAYLDELAGCYDEGRYTLAQAAETISESAGERYKAILQQLKLAVIDGKLPTYGRGSGLRYLKEGKRAHPSQVSQFGEQALWADLNQWLKQETKIDCQFPPPNMPDPAAVQNEGAIELGDDALEDDYSDDESILGLEPAESQKRSRRHHLDPIIDQAVAKARSLKAADVWITLREMALASEPPLLGTFEPETGAIGYTNSRNATRWLTLEALQARLKRRSSRSKQPVPGPTLTDANRR